MMVLIAAAVLYRLPGARKYLLGSPMIIALLLRLVYLMDNDCCSIDLNRRLTIFIRANWYCQG